MTLKLTTFLAVLALPAMSAVAAPECAQSPGHVIELCVSVQDGHATYQVSRLGKPVLASSNLGLEFVGEPEVHFNVMTGVTRQSSDTKIGRAHV